MIWLLPYGFRIVTQLVVGEKQRVKRTLTERKLCDRSVPQIVRAPCDAMAEGAKTRLVLTDEKGLDGFEHGLLPLLDTPKQN